MEPFAFTTVAAVLLGASVVKQYRSKPTLTGIAGVVQFSLKQITQSFVSSYKTQVPNTTKTYGADLQKILAFNQAQKHSVSNEQVYEWVALIGAQLHSISLKISVACTTDYDNCKKIRHTLVNALHKKICQQIQIPKHTREALAITVEDCVFDLFAVIHKRVKSMHTKRKLRAYWRNLTNKPAPSTDMSQVPVKDHSPKDDSPKDPQ